MTNNDALATTARSVSGGQATAFDSGLVWITLGAIAVVVLIALAISLRPSARRTAVYKFSTTIQLPIINDQIEAAAERRILHRTRATIAGAIVGLLATAAVVFFNPDIANGAATVIWLVALPLTLMGSATGSVLVALRESLFHTHTNAVRVARPITVTLSDYLSPVRLRLPAAVVLVAGVLNLVAFTLGLNQVIDTETFLRSAALPMLVAAIFAIVIGRTLARRLLAQPQPASSELELAWDDAFRADTLRGLWMFGAVIAWLAIAASGLGTLQGLDALHGTTWSLGLGSQLFTWGYLAILLTFSIGQAQRHFRFALWPDLVVDEPDSADGS
jgi:hypothetical protein